MPTSTLAAEPPSRIGGQVHTYDWLWQGQSLRVAYEVLGSGPPVLLLPAFSTVSTRAELGTLAQGLAIDHQVTVLDWPGFGDSDRLPLDYGPDLYAQFLQAFAEAVFNGVVAIVAAGHAAGYGVALAQTQPRRCSHLALVAPTWQGPLAVMGLPAAVRNAVRGAVASPGLGQVLYYLNTRPGFLRWMYERHVFADADRLTPGLLQQRYLSTQHAGARYGPAAFVTGGLDPASSQAEFVARLQELKVPVMVFIAAQAPPTSKAGMEALAVLPQLEAVQMSGSLGLAEEYGAEVAAQLRPFLAS